MPARVDIFIVPSALFRDGQRPQMRSTLLIQDDLVTVVGADHPLAEGAGAEPRAAPG